MAVVKRNHLEAILSAVFSYIEWLFRFGARLNLKAIVFGYNVLARFLYIDEVALQGCLKQLNELVDCLISP